MRPMLNRSLIELRLGERLPGLLWSSLGAVGALAGRRGRLLWLGKLAVDLLAKPPHLLR